MENLKQWTVEFIKHKDMIQKSILDIKENDVIHVKSKDKEQVFVVESEIESFQKVLDFAEKDMLVVMVCYNTKKNFDKLIKNWENLVKFKKLSVMFVNPKSNKDKKWIIYPATHNSICDPASLKTGLESMFAMVDEYSS